MARLLCDAKYRKKSGRFVIEGARLCADAVRSGIRVLTAFVTERAALRYETEWREIETVADKSYVISESLSRHLSDTDAPQGVFCLCERPLFTLARVLPDEVYVALENVQDPGNLGTVFRTAEALGVKGILLSHGCCDVYNPKVLRASMGGVFRLPFAVYEDFTGELSRLAESMPVLACVVDADACPVTAAPKHGAVAVIGNEGNGMSDKAIAVCTHRVTIPMAGRAESLNASMAAGILMWELCRDKAEG